MFETLAVATIIVGAVCYLGVDLARKVKAARSSRENGCGSSCGCSDH